MPYKIVSKKQLSENIYIAEIFAPLVAKASKPGQFVIICINNEYSENIINFLVAGYFFSYKYY